MGNGLQELLKWIVVVWFVWLLADDGTFRQFHDKVQELMHPMNDGLIRLVSSLKDASTKGIATATNDFWTSLPFFPSLAKVQVVQGKIPSHERWGPEISCENVYKFTLVLTQGRISVVIEGFVQDFTNLKLERSILLRKPAGDRRLAESVPLLHAWGTQPNDCAVWRITAAAVTVAKDFDWTIVHGPVLRKKVGKRIDHAWCERGEAVVDLAMPIGSRIIEREFYYRAVSHHGPWNESEQVET